MKNAENLLYELNHSTLFLQHNNLEITEIKPGYAKIELHVDPKVLNPYGIVHGGILFSMADTAAGTACLASGRECVTLNSSINFIKPGHGKKIIGIAQEISSGRSTCIYDVSLYNEDHTLISRSTFTMYCLDADHKKEFMKKAATNKAAFLRFILLELIFVKFRFSLILDTSQYIMPKQSQSQVQHLQQS